MGTFAPPWPPGLLKPVEHGAFRRVPGSQKEENHKIPAILGKILLFRDFQPFYLKRQVFCDFSLFGVPGPSKRPNIQQVLEGLDAMGEQGRPFCQNGVNLFKIN